MLLLLLSHFSRDQLVQPCPWDSPGKNTGEGCHFLLQCMKVKSESEVAQSCPTLSDPMGLQPTRLLRPWDFPGKSTGVGSHCLLRYRMLALVKFSNLFVFVSFPLLYLTRTLVIEFPSHLDNPE